MDFEIKERAQGMVEYALIIALITLVVVGTLAIIGKPIIEDFYQLIVTNWPG